MDTIDQVQKNFAAYVNEHREEMERTHLGKTLLMHDEKIVDAFEDRGWPTSAATRNTDSGISRSSQSAKNLFHLGAMSMALA